jgi:hypothetical protein
MADNAFGGLFGGLGGMFGGGGSNDQLAGLLGFGGGGGVSSLFGGGGTSASGILKDLAPNPLFGGIPNALNPVAQLFGGLFGGKDEKPPNQFLKNGLPVGDLAPYFASMGQRGIFNPSPFIRGIDSDTAKDVRKRSKRIFAPGLAALVAQDALLPASLFLTGKASAGYGNIWRDESRKSQDFFKESIERQSPGSNALFSTLTKDALDLVQSGTSPYDRKSDRDAILQAQASRGLGYGQGDAMAELLGLDRASEARRINRGNYGSNIARLGQGYYSQILGLGPAGSNIMSPVQATSTDDLLSLGLNDTQARRNQHAARVAGNQALWGNAIQAVGQIGGAVAKMCWVADELYGKGDSRSLTARAWCFANQHNLFVQVYQRCGAQWASVLRNNPRLKKAVRPIWDAMAKGGN